MKKFGVVMTQANLEAFALSQGITKSYNAMSQAEKVALRYNYVMNATAKAHGDFARTSGSWANQITILNEQFAQLLGILGKGLIAALTPALQALNKLLGYLISIGNAIAKIFGGKAINSTSTAITDASSAAGGLSDSIGDAEEGLDGAEGAAKKLQKTLGNFDELNIMSSQDAGGGAGGGAGAGGIGGGSGTIEGVTITDETEQEGQLSSLENFMKKAQDIVTSWFNSMPKLEINFDTGRALADLESIGLNIVNVIAGWGSFLVTIGIKLANDLDIGKLGNEFLGLIESITNLASKMTDVLVPAFIAFYDTGISPIVQWIGGKLADALIFTQGILDDWADWFTANKEKIIEFSGNLGEVVAALWSVVEPLGDTIWEEFKDLVQDISDAFQFGLDAILQYGTAIDGTTSQMEKDSERVKTALGNLVNEVNIAIEKIKNIPKLELHFDFQSALVDLTNIGANIISTIASWGTFAVTIAINVINDINLGNLANEVLGVTESATKLAATVSDAVVPALKNFYDTGISPIVKWIGEKLADALKFAQGLLNDWSKWFTENKEEIAKFGEKIGKVVEQLWKFVEPIADAAWEGFKITIKAISDSLQTFFNFILDNGDMVGAILTGVVTALVAYKAALAITALIEAFRNGTLLATAATTAQSVAQGILNAVMALNPIALIIAAIAALVAGFIYLWNNCEEFRKFWENLWDNIKKVFSSVVDGIKAGIDAIGDFFKDLWDKAVEIGKNVGEAFTAMKDKVVEIVKAVRDKAIEIWNAFKDKIVEVVTAIRDKVAEFFTAIRDKVVEIVTAIRDKAVEIWTAIKDKIVEVVTAVRDRIVEIFNAIRDKIVEIVNAIKDKIVAIWNTIKTTITNVVNGLKDGVVNTFNNIKNSISNVVTGLKDGVVNTFNALKDGAVNAIKALLTALKTPINGIIGLLNGLIKGIVSGINGAINALNKLNITVPDWVPLIGGNKFGFNLKTLTAPQIPLLANGGVITSPTVAMMGEYPGASTNPEIVAPQSILREIVNEGNVSLVEALYQMCTQIVDAINNQELGVQIGDDVIASSAARGNEAYKRRTGTPLFA